jgi:hypothetical protein
MCDLLYTLTVDDATKLTGRDRDTIARNCKGIKGQPGKIAARKIAGKVWMINEESLLLWDKYTQRRK